MITSFSLYLGLMASFGCFAWLLVRLAMRRRWTSLTEETGHGHFQAVDGLRGVLALSVYVHHAWCMRNLCVRSYWTSEGDQVLTQAALYAVTLFFFITGFVFWTKLQRNPRLALGEHLRSRIARLAPAYWASLAVVALYVATHPDQPLWQEPLQTARQGFSWLIFTLPDIGTVNTGAIICRNFAGITWTLRLEWIFYLLIPFCGWFARKGGRALWFFGWMLGLHVVANLTSEGWLFRGVIPPAQSAVLVEVTHYLTYCFCGGVFVASLRPWIAARVSPSAFQGQGWALVGLGGVVATILWGPWGYGWLESAGLLVPFLLIALGNDWFGLLTSRSVRLLGKISYSVYLLHTILLTLTFHYINVHYPVQNIPAPVYWLIIALLGGGLIAVSACWFCWFERPFLGLAQAAPPPVRRA